MGFFDRFTVRGKASALYKRGLDKAHHDDFVGAIQDYTAVIETRGVPTDLKAMALFNRGLAYSLEDDLENAKKDFQAVESMAGAPSNVLSAAKEKLRRMQKRSERHE
jgi:hypothetical protein